MAWDRYSYVENRPTMWVDPSGNYKAESEAYYPRTNGWLKNWDLDNSGDANSNSELRRIASTRTAENSFVSSMHSPTLGKRVTTLFGARNTLGGPGYHPGVDIIGPNNNILDENEPIYATAYGVVVAVQEDPTVDLGRKVVVEHTVYGEKYYTIYCHLSRTSAYVGQFVDSYTIVGYMGNTPFPEGSVHLHFEARKAANVQVDRFGKYMGLPGDADSYWADGTAEMRLRWVDISSKFGGYSNVFPR